MSGQENNMNRQPAGSPDGGKFAVGSAAGEADANLLGGGDLARADAAGRGPFREWDTVPDDVSDSELESLGDPSAPLRCRVMVANTPYPGVGERASRDPHPLVRAIALTSWDLNKDDATRLSHDVDVSRALNALGATAGVNKLRQERESAA